MLSPLCSFGHIADYRELMEYFRGQDSAITPFRMAFRRATVLYQRRNVYVCAHLSADELTAASARRRAEPIETRAHWTVPSWPVITVSEARMAARRASRALDPATHPATHPSRLELPVEEALRQALTSCLTVPESLEAIEALLPRLGARKLAQVVQLIPDRGRTALRRAGLPVEVSDALVGLSRGNKIYAT